MELIATRGSLYPPFFRRGKSNEVGDGFDFVNAIRIVSKNRERIPDRYWSEGGTIRLATEITSLQTGNELVSNFLLVGKKDSQRCRLTASADSYSDSYECDTDEFADALRSLRWTRADLDRLKELYVLVKDNLQISDLVWCANMEVRRDTIKRMEYKEVRKYAKVLDTHEDYELIDLSFQDIDFGRFLKMKDSTSGEAYLLLVPRSRDFGSVKIPMKTCKQALAWSYEIHERQYKPEIET